MTIDAYLTDVLMRDLVAHDRSAAAFLVYLQLYGMTHGAGRRAVAISHASLAEVSGVSKRTVQTAIAHLSARRLVHSHRSSPTAVPVYTVMRPWAKRSGASSA